MFFGRPWQNFFKQWNPCIFLNVFLLMQAEFLISEWLTDLLDHDLAIPSQTNKEKKELWIIGNNAHFSHINYEPIMDLIIETYYQGRSHLGAKRGPSPAGSKKKKARVCWLVFTYIIFEPLLTLFLGHFYKKKKKKPKTK